MSEIRFYKNKVEKNGTWHLYEKGNNTCLCGITSEGESHDKIPIEKRELCWPCHSKAHDFG